MEKEKGDPVGLFPVYPVKLDWQEKETTKTKIKDFKNREHAHPDSTSHLIGFSFRKNLYSLPT